MSNLKERAWARYREFKVMHAEEMAEKIIEKEVAKLKAKHVEHLLKNSDKFKIDGKTWFYHTLPKGVYKKCFGHELKDRRLHFSV